MASAHSLPPNAPLGSPIRQWDGAMPLLMSLTVLVIVVVELWKHGLHAPHHDEETADHIAMLLMYGQVPILFWFVASRRGRVRRILPTLALQLGLWMGAFVAAVGLT